MERKTPEEDWKPILGFEGLYEISNLGRVFSIGRNKIMKTNINKCGYVTIQLCKLAKRKMMLVHRLVAIAFIPNPENKPEVNHKKGIKSDNRASELEWMTISENEKHSYEVLNKVKSQLGKPLQLLPQTMVQWTRVSQYDLNGTHIKDHLSLTRAENDTGISRFLIKQCCNGVHNQSGGYKWTFNNQPV